MGMKKEFCYIDFKVALQRLLQSQYLHFHVGPDL
ncbi:hypothetical protein BH10BAC4_BH10BAC4_03290 [soil metagenome]